MRSFKYLIYIVLSSYMVSFASSSDKEYKQDPTPAICGDFLEQIGKKPEGVVFDSCTTYAEWPAYMKAVYKLTGKNADVVEQYLVKEVDMATLRFVCCGWWEASDPTKFGATYKDPKTNYKYSIDMHSDESLISDRQKWSYIPTFYIIVIPYVEEI